MSKPTTPKKEVMSLRIEPKLKYLIDLAARVQRRNLTNYVESALDESLKNVFLESHDSITKKMSIHEAGTIPNFIWSADESSRFLTLALYYRDLLTYEEQKIWDAIQSFPNIFYLNPNRSASFDNINSDNIKKYWDLILKSCRDDEQVESINALQQIDLEKKQQYNETIEEINKIVIQYSLEKDSLLKDAKGYTRMQKVAILEAARSILEDMNS